MLFRFVVCCLVFLISLASYCQEDRESGLLIAVVIDSATKQPMQQVNVLNLNEVKGTLTDLGGEFRIKASVNDTIFLSYVGFESVKVKVTNDMFRFRTQIAMTESIYALEEVVVRPYKLTGDLYVDAKNAPIEVVPVYSISGLPYSGYRASSNVSVTGRVFQAVFHPVDALYKIFSREGKNMRKMIKIRKNQEVRRMLASKFDRETLSAFLQIEKDELESILLNCNYSKTFIQYSNDLQILEAISDCYEEYKVLKRASDD